MQIRASRSTEQRVSGALLCVGGLCCEGASSEPASSEQTSSELADGSGWLRVVVCRFAAPLPPSAQPSTEQWPQTELSAAKVALQRAGGGEGAPLTRQWI